MKTLQIALPHFQGFYETELGDLFEISDDLENHGDISQEDYDNIDWKQYKESVGKMYFEQFWEQVGNTLKTFGIIDMVFAEIDSPMFYNYRTDELIVAVDYDPAVFAAQVMEQINKYPAMFEQLVKDRHSSRSGFSSFYSDEFNDWLEFLSDMDNVHFETFLTFLMNEELEDYNERDILDYIYEHKYEILDEVV